MTGRQAAPLTDAERAQRTNEHLRAMGIDTTLPWLPLTAQPDLFAIAPRIPDEPTGEIPDPGQAP